MRNKSRSNIDWEGLYAKGENPKGFTSQTPNGTAHWQGTGWNDDPWGRWEQPQLEPGPTRPAGRSNRTGE